MPSVSWCARSTPTPPRAPRRSMPAEASRRPWLPAAMRPRPCTPSPPAPRRVNTWITPPIASAPYSEERGPRTISMRSICASGMSCSEVRPEVELPTRMPSTRNRVWSDSVPRRNSVLSLPMPPWLTMVMPARPRSSSGSDRALLASSCLRSITSTAASVASAVVAVRVAVTTRLSRSFASSLCANASDGKDKASASALERSGVLQDCMTILRRARPRAQQGGAVAARRTRETGEWTTHARRRAMPAASQPTDFRAGLRAGERNDTPIEGLHSRLAPSHAASYRCGHSGRCQGYLAYRCGGSAGLDAQGASSPASRFNPRAVAVGSP